MLTLIVYVIMSVFDIDSLWDRVHVDIHSLCVHVRVDIDSLWDRVDIDSLRDRVHVDIDSVVELISSYAS